MTLSDDDDGEGLLSSISRHVHQLRNASTVTVRREAGSALRRKLCDKRIRYHLSEEIWQSMDPAESLWTRQASRRDRLATLWRLAISNAILAATSGTVNASRGQQINEHDLSLPFKLLAACDEPDPDDDTPLGPWARLDDKTVRRCVEFALTMLDDERARNMDEKWMLDILAHMSARINYVQFFRVKIEISAIFRLLEKRISDPSVDVLVKTFQSLMETCRTLGVGLNMVLLPGVTMISKWCQKCVAERQYVASTIVRANELLRGVVVLIRSEPEQAVAVLTRHGKGLLNFCIHVNKVADFRLRSSVLEYFLCHLFIAQVSGHLHGFMPGDLGPLGDSSLTSDKIDDILGVLMEGGPTFVATPECDGLRHLELVAKLIACSQRQYMSECSWRANETVMKCFDDAMGAFDGTYFPEAFSLDRQNSSSNLITESPFMRRVAGVLFKAIPESSMHWMNGFSIAIVSRASDSADRQEQCNLPYFLQIFESCADYFPSGACWVSSAQAQWTDLQPASDRSNESYLSPLFGGVVRLRICSCEMLAILLEMLCSLLHAYGDFSDDELCARHILSALLKMVDVSAFLAGRVDKKSDIEGVEAAWRNIWKALFSGDHRYVPATREADGDSDIGRLTLRVAIGIVRQKTTDIGKRNDLSDVTLRQESFQFSRQIDLWNLPVFGTKPVNTTALPFLLISESLYSVGLNCAGRDQISTSLLYALPREDRRSRLVQFCLRSIHDFSTQQSVRAVASHCCAMLIYGCVLNLSPCARQDLYAMATLEENGRGDRSTARAGHFRANASARRSSSRQSLREESLFSTLFAVHNRSATVQWQADCADEHLDVAEVWKSDIEHFMMQRHQDQVSADSISKAATNVLYEVVDASFAKLLTNLEDERSDRCSCFRDQLILFRLFITLSSRPCCSPRDTNIEAVSNDLYSRMRVLLRNLDNGVRSPTTLGDIATANSVIMSIRCATSTGECQWPSQILECTRDLYHVVHRFLRKVVKGGFNESKDAQGEQLSSIDRSVYTSKGIAHRDGGSQSFQTSWHNSELATLVALGTFLVCVRPCSASTWLLVETAVLVSGIDAYYGVSLLSIYLASPASLLNSASVIDDSGKSSATVICELLKCIQSRVTTYPIIAPFGFLAARDLVGSWKYNNMKLSNEDAEGVSAIGNLFTHLNSDIENALEERSGLRAVRLRSALLAFVEGSVLFHKQFDKPFRSDFVLPAIQDLSALVRRWAIPAVAAACRALTARKVAKAVMSFLSPFVDQNGYRAWYQEVNRIKGAQDQPVQQLLDDLYLSFQKTAAFCVGAMFVSTNAFSTVAYVVNLVRECAVLSPCHTCIFLQLVDQISMHLSVASYDEMSEYLKPRLVKAWLEEGRALFELPLAFTGIASTFAILQAGWWVYFSDHPIGKHCHDRWAVDSAKHWIALQRNFLASAIIWTSATVNERIFDHPRAMLESENIRELCLASKWVFSDENAKKVIKAAMQQTLAIAVAVRSEGKGIAEDMVAFILKMFPLEDRLEILGSDKAQFWRCILFFSAALADFHDRDIAMLTLLDDLDDLASTLLGGNYRPFVTFGTCVDILVATKVFMCKTSVLACKDYGARFSESLLQIVHKRFLKDEITVVQFGTSLQVLATFVDLSREDAYRPRFLAAISRTFVESLCGLSRKAAKSGSLGIALKEVLASAMEIHEYCQAFIDRERKVFEAGLRRLMAWTSDSSLHDFGRKPPDRIIFAKDLIEHLRPTFRFCLDGLLNSYGIVSSCVQLWKADFVDEAVLIGGLPPYVTPRSIQQILGSEQKEYCAQELMHQSARSFDIGSLCDRALEGLLSANIVPYEFDHLKLAERNVVTDRILHSQLLLVEKALESHFDVVGGDERVMLVVAPLLVISCKHSLPRTLRLAAGRCLAKLGGRAASVSVFALSQSPTTKSPQLNMLLRSHCVTCAYNLLVGGRDERANIAGESLTAIAATQDGVRCLRYLAEPAHGYAKSIDKLVQEQNTLVETIEVPAFGNRDEGQSDVCAWADPVLWTTLLKENWPFEKWACSVVAGLLYERNRMRREAPDFEADFLDCAQRLALADCTFAAKIFNILLLCACDNFLDAAGFDEGEVLFDNVGLSFDRICACLKALIGECCRSVDSVRYACFLTFAVESCITLRRYLCRKLSDQHTRAGSQSTNSSPKGAGTGCRLVTNLDRLIDTSLLSRACVKLGRHADALFYAEWYGDATCGGSAQRLLPISRSPIVDQECTIVSVAQSESSTNIRVLCDLLEHCYTGLDDNLSRQVVHSFRIGIYESNVTACSNADGLDRLRLANLRANFPRDRLNHQIALSEALSSFGLGKTVELVVEGLLSRYSNLFDTNEGGAIQSKWYETKVESLLWKSGDELEAELMVSCPVQSTTTPPSAHKVVFESLGDIVRGDFSSCQARLVDGMVSRFDVSCPHAFFAQSKFRDVTSALRGFCEIATLLPDEHRSLFGSSSLFRDSDLITVDDARLPNPNSSFLRCAAELSMRVKWATGLGGEDGRGQLATFLFDCLNLDLGAESESVLSRLNDLLADDRPASLNMRLGIFDCKFREARGDFRDALQKCLKIVDFSRASRDHDVLVDALLFCGELSSKHQVEPTKIVLKKYVTEAVDVAKTLFGIDGSCSMTNARMASAHFAFAKLAFRLFEVASERLSSPEWKQSVADLSERKTELAQCGEMISALADNRPKKKQRGNNFGAPADMALYRQRDNLEKEILHTETEHRQVILGRSMYRREAMTAISAALSHADASMQTESLHFVHRLTSMWFSAADDSIDDADLTKVITDVAVGVPTHWFVPLIPQLFARLKSKDSAGLYRHVSTLVCRLSADHPFHCLTHLLAQFLDPVSAKSAAKVENFLRKHDPVRLGSLIDNYKCVCDAYIRLAYFATDNLAGASRNKISFDKVCTESTFRLDKCLRKGNLTVDHAPCILTKIPSVRPGGDYWDSEGGLRDSASDVIKAFDDTFSITPTGVSRPKVVVCTGSKGKRFKQLVKQEEDIRQDVIMEQVFGLVNAIMAQSTSAKQGGASLQRQLRLCTYTVVALGHEVGVLEWVDGSQSLTEIINARKSGLHERYYQHEWRPSACRESLEKAAGTDKRDAYDTVCRNHSAVFRFFFIEVFDSSAERWYAAKSAFTRSVAVGSIVGHILGIGDRHGGNILVSQLTGEIIHIDFGIVFEQGRLLPTPEVVPFRLTRNIVDGLGPVGTNGPFAAAAEMTLSMLKENTAALSTIFGAIVSDPLYKWRRNALKMREKQLAAEARASLRESRVSAANEGADEGGQNKEDTRFDKKAAARTVARINQKLQGYEDGTSGEQQSVKGQVQLMINAARDPDNLCKMFPGWAPWM